MMPTSKTKALARKLGLLRKRKAEEHDACRQNKKRRKGQLLSFVIVIDFESTCWKDKKGAQEIIEFPAVLLDLQTGDIVDEFQQYVHPQDCPILSDFCKELTGISQAQVDGGVPLPTCLYLFGKWVKALWEKRGVVLMEPGRQYNNLDTDLCALATWSDWDLGVCLQYECRRKQIRKPSYFNHWIDLRVVYKQFYDRRPAGLCGSLEDLGIPFTGREHCGLDDARNTAKLCFHLVKDGCRLNITKSLCKRKPDPVLRAPMPVAEHSKEVERCLSRKIIPSHENQTDNIQPKLNPGKVGCEAKGDVVKTPDSDQPCSAEEWIDESFLNGIVHEFDQLERNNYEVPTSTGDQCTTVKLTPKPVPIVPTKTEATPSRSHVLTHISPITLLPSAQDNTRKQHCDKMTTLQSSHRQQHTVATRASSCSNEHTPAAPACTPSHTSTGSKNVSHITHAPATRRTAAVNVQATSTTSTDFHTPSTTQWMKLKSSVSPSTLTCDSLQPFNGGKITPPLCNCGKRARRKMVTGPGPNQGKPFFSCPGGRETGCQYFRWENTSPFEEKHTSTRSSCIVNLTSEYNC